MIIIRFYISVALLILLNLIKDISPSTYIQSEKDFINTDVVRTIDLRNLIVKIKTKIFVKNMKVDPISQYRMVLLKNYTKSLLNIEAKMSLSEEDSESIKLKVNKQHKSSDEYVYFDLSFRTEPMNHEEERVITITEYYSDQYELLPKKIYLTENQYVVFNNTKNYISYYTTNKQKTKIKLPVEYNKIINYSKEKAVVDKNKISYIYEQPLKDLYLEEFRIHYEFNNYIAQFNTVEKSFEISHWGNIAIEEKYFLENVGAKLEGEFGRVDYDDHGLKGGKNALRSLEELLPLRANNLWFRDDIGNVSTSTAVREWDNVKLEIEPRFPLLGGWKTTFMVGYSLPLKFHVSVNKEVLHVANLTFGLGYNDIIAKNFTYKVVLPEHSVITKVDLPIDSPYKISYDKTYSFLDLFGRTTVIITMNNVFDIHRVPILVSIFNQDLL